MMRKPLRRLGGGFPAHRGENPLARSTIPAASPKTPARTARPVGSWGGNSCEVAALSPLEFVEQEFQNDVIRAGLLFFNGLREVDLRLQGIWPHHSRAAFRAAHGADVPGRLGETGRGPGG